jgi:hypothetical protein
MFRSAPKAIPKVAPTVALVQLDPATSEILRKAFEQSKIQTVPAGVDFIQRLSKEQFQGCVLRLDDDARVTLEAVRSSRSNRRMIVYGIMPEKVDFKRFSPYGINAVLDSPLDRNAVLISRSTAALLLNELRRYIRIPIVIDVDIETKSEKFSGSSREISGGGMSVRVTGPFEFSEKVRLTFRLPEKPLITIEAVAVWQKAGLFGFQFETSNPAREVVKDWINAFLGL